MRRANANNASVTFNNNNSIAADSSVSFNNRGGDNLMYARGNKPEEEGSPPLIKMNQPSN